MYQKNKKLKNGYEINNQYTLNLHNVICELYLNLKKHITKIAVKSATHHATLKRVPSWRMVMKDIL